MEALQSLRGFQSLPELLKPIGAFKKTIITKKFFAVALKKNYRDY